MKGDRNKELRQNQPFCTFLTFALPINKQTDMTSYRSARTHLKRGGCDRDERSTVAVVAVAKQNDSSGVGVCSSNEAQVLWL